MISTVSMSSEVMSCELTTTPLTTISGDEAIPEDAPRILNVGDFAAGGFADGLTTGEAPRIETTSGVVTTGCGDVTRWAEQAATGRQMMKGRRAVRMPTPLARDHRGARPLRTAPAI